jgi:hypothetical protein
MKYNRKAGVLIKWEYFERSEYDIKNGIQNDPICCNARLSSLEEAIHLANTIQEILEDDLRVIDITLRLYPEGEKVCLT